MRRAVALIASVTLLLTAPPATAQKGGKPPTDRPGALSVSPNCVAGEPVAGVEGDCTPSGLLGPAVYDADAFGTYARLNGNREMRAGLYGNRWLRLDFRSQVGPALCGTTCFRDFDVVVTDLPATSGSEGSWTAVMQTNVVDDAGNEVIGGLMSLAEGETRNARFFVSFPDPNGGAFHWSVRYYPQLYTGTDYASVTRLDGCTWQVASAGAHRGGLIAYGVLKGRNNSTKEGIFQVPFSMTFTLDGCTP
jgi:hypothetical protein